MDDYQKMQISQSRSFPIASKLKLCLCRGEKTNDDSLKQESHAIAGKTSRCVSDLRKWTPSRIFVTFLAGLSKNFSGLPNLWIISD